MRATGAQVGGQLAGGEAGVDGDHRSGQQAPLIQRGGQRHSGGNLTPLAGLGRAAELPESDAAGVVVGSDQMSTAAAATRDGNLLGSGAGRGASQRLAVDRDHPPTGADRCHRPMSGAGGDRLLRGQPTAGPAGHRRIQRRGVGGLQTPAHRRLARHRRLFRPVGKAVEHHGALRGGPLTDRHVRPRPGQLVPTSPPVASVGHRRQRGGQ